MEPIALYAVAGAIAAAIVLQIFVAQVWSRRTIHQVRAGPSTEQASIVPYFGHLFHLLIGGDAFLQRARDNVTGAGHYSIRILGRVYHMVYDPQLIDAVKKSASSSISSRGIVLQIFENVFNLPPQPEAVECALQLAMDRNDPTVKQKSTTAILGTLQLQLPDFLSYMSALIDQALWERDTIISISDDHDTATVAFQELFRNFATHQILTTLLPANLLETHPHAGSFVLDLWKIQAATFPLALGLPRWVPMPRLTTAHISRRNVLRTLSDLINALDKLDSGAEAVEEWQNLDREDISPFLADFQRRTKVSKNGSTPSPEARASILLARLMALCVQVTELAFWTIAHLSTDSLLLAQLRDEIKPAVNAKQPASSFGIEEPVRLTLKTESLSKCPTLQATYLESVRLYDRSFDVAVLTGPFELATGMGGDKAHRAQQGAPKIKFARGSHVVAAPWLYNTDASEFLHARKWWPERHLDVDSVDDGEVIVPQGLVAGLAGGAEMTRELATALVAGFVAIWDVKLVNGLPKAKRSVSVAGPKGDVKAEVRRRDLSVA